MIQIKHEVKKNQTQTNKNQNQVNTQTATKTIPSWSTELVPGLASLLTPVLQINTLYSWKPTLVGWSPIWQITDVFYSIFLNLFLLAYSMIHSSVLSKLRFWTLKVLYYKYKIFPVQIFYVQLSEKGTKLYLDKKTELLVQDVLA